MSKILNVSLIFLLSIIHFPMAQAGENSLPAPWDLGMLRQAPVFSLEGPPSSTEDIQAIKYEGSPLRGASTSVFAYVGVPKIATKIPGVVLVHGGGGKAQERWVRLWNKRGFAAISLDTRGSGQWDKSFEQTDEPVVDQWPFRTVANIVKARALLASLPGVDGERIGITGISWGGYLTCIAAGVEPKFAFAAPVYGCGFLGEDSVWVPTLAKIGPEKAARWLKLWDPSEYLPRVRMPMLWVDGNTDFAYPISSLQKSYRLPLGERWLCMRPGMSHGHQPGENPEEIGVFASQVVAGGEPLVRCNKQGIDQHLLWAEFSVSGTSTLVKAQCAYTASIGPYDKRTWKVETAQLEAKSRASFALPAGTTAAFLFVTDERNLVASCEHITLELTEKP